MPNVTGRQAVIKEMLIDLGIKGQAADDASEAAQERIRAGTPPMLALLQEVVAQARALQSNCRPGSGLTPEGNVLARRIWDLLSWPTEEFDQLVKAGPA